MTQNTTTASRVPSSPRPFFALTFALRRGCWIPAAVLIQGGPSTRSTILFHLAYNLTFSLVYPVPKRLHLTGTLLLGAVVVIEVVWGPKTLTRRAAVPGTEPWTRHET